MYSDVQVVCVVVQVNAQVEVWDYSLWWWLCINISECTAVNKYTSCDMICTTAYTQSILIIIYSQRYVYNNIYSVMHWYSDVHDCVKYSSDGILICDDIAVMIWMLSQWCGSIYEFTEGI